jgi:hypothetical protein
MIYSTRTLDQWPAQSEFRKLAQSLAVLSLCQDDTERYSYTHQARPGISFFSMSNGQGDEAAIVFTPEGCIFRGFAHESDTANWDGLSVELQNELPAELRKHFAAYLEGERASFVAWQLSSESHWRMSSMSTNGDHSDGSEDIFEYLPFDPSVYVDYESEYYGREIDLAAVKTIYSHSPLTQELIQKLNPSCRTTHSDPRLTFIGYPVAK